VISESEYIRRGNEVLELYRENSKLIRQIEKTARHLESIEQAHKTEKEGVAIEVICDIALIELEEFRK